VYELLTYPHHLPAAVRAAAELPGTDFVLDHCSKPPITAGETGALGDGGCVRWRRCRT